MGFEAKVMQVVEDTLGKDEMNGFAHGTLWVNCFPEDAKKLLKTLNKEFNNKVVMSQSKCHMEFAYDFVA